MPGEPWTDGDDLELARLHAQQLSLSECARRMGKPKGTASRAGARLGLSWDRGHTAAAVRAKQIDAMARRRQAIEQEYEITLIAQRVMLETVRDGQPWRTILKTETGGEDVASLPFVPAIDARNLADARSRSLLAAAKLEDADRGAEVSRVQSVLGGLAKRLLGDEA